jgi:hypothetical protein
MQSTGMNPQVYQHYRRVAMNMNNYVAASSNSHNRRRDGHLIDAYHAASYPDSRLGNQIAYQLQSLDISSGIAHLGQRIGQWIDNYS